MNQRSETTLPLLSFIFDTIAIAYNFLAGFFLGVVAPVAAIAAVVAGIRFLTGLVPFLGDIAEDEEGGRHLSLQLVSPEEAKELYYGHKEQMGGELTWMKDEIQAIIEEAKAEAEASEETPEVPSEV
jgi:hypothetical protein